MRDHGTVQRYWAGCRCSICGISNKEYNQQYASSENGKLARDKAGKKFRSSSYGKEDQLRRDLKRHFDITLEHYRTLERAQNGLCKICNNKCSSGKRLAVDHNHITGKIRGLLCHNCNTGIGKFKDSENLLQSAINYLKT